MYSLRLPLLFLAFLLLSAYSLLFVFSSTLPPYAEGDLPLNELLSDSFFKQLIFISGGFLVMMTIGRIPYRKLTGLANPFFLFHIFLLALLLVAGKKAGGAQSWFDLKVFQFQPSETTKVAWVLFMASYLRYRKGWESLYGLMTPFLITGIPLLLILIQPDMGSAFVFIPSLFFLLFLSGAKPRHLGIILLIGCIVLVPMWHFAMKDYQKGRIMAFLNPEQYELTYSYQLNYSLLGISEGYWTGKGIGQGAVNRLSLLPDRHTDFIFSVIAEELGFLGGLGLIFSYALLLYAVFSVALSTQDSFGRMLALGVGVILGVQVCINTFVAIGLMPTTGVTLPFISAGGSSMIASCVLLGLVISVARYRRSVFGRVVEGTD